METEWLFEIFPSTGRCDVSSPIIFGEASSPGASVLPMASDTLFINAATLFTADEDSNDFSADTSSNAMLSVNSSNRFVFNPFAIMNETFGYCFSWTHFKKKKEEFL